jgi:hypothetical protein
MELFSDVARWLIYGVGFVLFVGLVVKNARPDLFDYPEEE